MKIFLSNISQNSPMLQEKKPDLFQAAGIMYLFAEIDARGANVALKKMKEEEKKCRLDQWVQSVLDELDNASCADDVQNLLGKVLVDKERFEEAVGGPDIFEKLKDLNDKLRTDKKKYDEANDKITLDKEKMQKEYSNPNKWLAVHASATLDIKKQMEAMQAIEKDRKDLIAPLPHMELDFAEKAQKDEAVLNGFLDSLKVILNKYKSN